MKIDNENSEWKSKVINPLISKSTYPLAVRQKSASWRHVFLPHYYEVGGSLKYYRYQAIKICVNYGITKSQIKNREILDQFYAILIIF